MSTSAGFWSIRKNNFEMGSCSSLSPLLAQGWSIRYLRQVHGPLVLGDGDFRFCGQEADGLTSVREKVALVIRTADCVPIHLCDGERIGMLHAGWRGVRSGILDTLPRHFALDRLEVILGPAICGQDYEVGPDLYAPWLAEEPELSAYLAPSPNNQNKCLFELRGWIRHILERMKVNKIDIIPICTYETILPSYRRDASDAARIINYTVRI